MIGALESLKRAHDPQPLPDAMRAFGIASVPGGGLKALFMTHPPLDVRIAALRNSTAA
jgi:heat shock protein HtpX